MHHRSVLNSFADFMYQVSLWINLYIHGSSFMQVGTSPADHRGNVEGTSRYGTHRLGGEEFFSGMVIQRSVGSLEQGFKGMGGEVGREDQPQVLSSMRSRKPTLWGPRLELLLSTVVRKLSLEKKIWHQRPWARERILKISFYWRMPYTLIAQDARLRTWRTQMHSLPTSNLQLFPLSPSSMVHLTYIQYLPICTWKQFVLFESCACISFGLGNALHEF